MLLSMLDAALGPSPPGSPGADLRAVLAEAVRDADGRGVVRVSLATDEPQGIEALVEELSEAEILDDDRLRMSFDYQPIP